MNDFYTFIVSSTINCGIGVIENQNRFKETLETLDSIRRKIPDAKIVFADNSIQSLTDEQKEELKSRADVCLFIDHNLFTFFANGVGSKGLGEAYLVFMALTEIEKHNLIGKRIFKISGRYRLADSFDITEYEDSGFQEKYAFRINQWDVSLDNFKTDRRRVVYFETRLYSFCGSLFYEYGDVVKKCFKTMIEQYGEPMCNWEICHWMHVPHNKVIEKKPIHVEGLNAENGIYRFE